MILRFLERILLKKKQEVIRLRWQKARLEQIKNKNMNDKKNGLHNIVKRV